MTKLFQPLNQKKIIFIGQKILFSVKNSQFFKIENLGTYILIFDNFRNWASFSPHFWIIQWKLKPLITNGITVIFKIENTVCNMTRCKWHKKLTCEG